jgi:hypothetical protein
MFFKQLLDLSLLPEWKYHKCLVMLVTLFLSTGIWNLNLDFKPHTVIIIDLDYPIQITKTCILLIAGLESVVYIFLK